MTRAERLDNGYRCWELAIACLREKGVRSGDYAPINETERQWASEGPVEPARLQSVQWIA